MTDNRAMTTKDRILDAAERSFANHGFEGASIRAIVMDAGVNLASIHYHFRSKEALLEAAAPHPPSVEEILRAFIVPTVEFAQRDKSGATFVQLMSRMFTEPRFSLTDFLGRKFGDTIGHFSAALVRALPRLPRDIVLWRAFFTIGAMHHLLCSPGKIDFLAKGLRRSTPIADMTQYLIEYSAAGMCAANTATDIEVKTHKKTDHSRRHK